MNNCKLQGLTYWSQSVQVNETLVTGWGRGKGKGVTRWPAMYKAMTAMIATKRTVWIMHRCKFRVTSFQTTSTPNLFTEITIVFVVCEISHSWLTSPHWTFQTESKLAWRRLCSWMLQRNSSKLVEKLESDLPLQSEYRENCFGPDEDGQERSDKENMFEVRGKRWSSRRQTFLAAKKDILPGRWNATLCMKIHSENDDWYCRRNICRKFQRAMLKIKRRNDHSTYWDRRPSAYYDLSTQSAIAFTCEIAFLLCTWANCLREDLARIRLSSWWCLFKNLQGLRHILSHDTRRHLWKFHIISLADN